MRKLKFLNQLPSGQSVYKISHRDNKRLLCLIGLPDINKIQISKMTFAQYARLIPVNFDAATADGLKCPLAVDIPLMASPLHQVTGPGTIIDIARSKVLFKL